MRIAELEVVEGVAAGVPFVALPPADPAAPAALLAGWHLMEPPASERALAAALPMAGLQAWRVYFGLPLTGARLPGGGPAELFRLASEDAVLNVFEPVTDQAAGSSRRRSPHCATGCRARTARWASSAARPARWWRWRCSPGETPTSPPARS